MKVENMHGFDEKFWQGKKVLVTGHTGFKGAWLCAWLHKLGAKLEGVSLPAPSRESLVWQEIKNHLGGFSDKRGDICDFNYTRSVFQNFKPEIVFHLAAQAIVLDSYEDMETTWNTNVMGTLSVLEGASAAGAKAAIIVTSDKCYENKDWDWGYRETDHLGGGDPYSASKAACEILTQSWRHSKSAASGLLVASARAGNVIGGGDNAPYRIVPEMIASFREGKAGVVRNPKSTRPFQHVLEPLSGYMLLAKKLFEQSNGARDVFCDQAFNFGPDSNGEKTALWLAQSAAKAWGGAQINIEENLVQNKKEARVLMLDSSKAKKILKWHPTWDALKAVEKAVEWEKERVNFGHKNITFDHINEYEKNCEAIALSNI